MSDILPTEEMLAEIADKIGDMFEQTLPNPEKIGFGLFVFDSDQNARMITNMDMKTILLHIQAWANTINNREPTKIRRKKKPLH